MLELLIWGARHEETSAPGRVIDAMEKNREQVLAEVERRWRERDGTPLLAKFQEPREPRWLRARKKGRRMSSDLQTLANQFKFNNGIYERTVRGIPPEQWLIQPSPESNHLLWVVGHAAVSRAVALRLLGGGWSAPWQNLFSRGQKKVDDGQYPSVAEVQQAWNEISGRLMSAFATASPKLMDKPVEKGKPSTDGTVGGTVAFLCLHESYHLGQTGLIRKWLGHGQALG
jgi:hypothetical protein